MNDRLAIINAPYSIYNNRNRESITMVYCENNFQKVIKKTEDFHCVENIKNPVFIPDSLVFFNTHKNRALPCQWPF